MIPLRTIRNITAKTPDRSAVISAHAALSWKDFQQRTEATLEFLLQHFDSPPSTLAFYVVQNQIELLPWLSACATLGISITGIDYTLENQTIARIIDGMGADFILYSRSVFPEEAYAHCNNIRFFDIDLPAIPLAAINPVTLPDRIRISDSVSRPFCSISFTSGSSGFPKSVIRTQSFDRRRFDYFISRHNFTEDDKFLLSMPLYHAAGNGWARLFLGLGATVYLTDIESPEDIVDAFVNSEITATVMHPNLLRLVLDMLDTFGQNFILALRWLLVGGKNFPPSLKHRALNQLGDVVYEYYGTTETGLNTLVEPSDLRCVPSSVGRPIEGNSIAIVDADGTELPKRIIGSVVVESYMNMHSYGDGSVNELFIKGVRYLWTPDHGYLDEDGRLYLVNRTGTGRAFYPVYRLEDHIRRLHGVTDVFMLQRGSSPKPDCALALRQSQVITEQMIEEIKRLAADQMIELANVYIVDRIPYNPSGKVNTMELKQMIGVEMVA